MLSKSALQYQISMYRNDVDCFGEINRQAFLDWVTGFLGCNKINQAIVPFSVIANIYCLYKLQMDCDKITDKKAQIAQNWIMLKAGKV